MVGCFLLSPENEITQADKIALLGLHLFAQISKPKPRERDLKPEALRAKPGLRFRVLVGAHEGLGMRSEVDKSLGLAVGGFRMSQGSRFRFRADATEFIFRLHKCHSWRNPRCFGMCGKNAAVR